MAISILARILHFSAFICSGLASQMRVVILFFVR